MERKKTIICLILLLMPFATGTLLNLYLFYTQFRGGFPISWFFRYSTGEGSSTVILFIDWTALAIDLLIFLAVGIFCLFVYAFARMKRGSLPVL
jgi:hypothetical protein